MIEAVLYTRMSDGSVGCAVCAHRCIIAPGKTGVCGVRRNESGTLRTAAYGRVGAVNRDPIEKKPLFHFLPGTTSYSVAAIGCNFRCSFCQNWEISQAQEAERLGVPTRPLTPEEIVAQARASGARSISFTYTEPTIFLEYALATAQKAKQAGLATVFVSNGYMTAEALDLIGPYLDAANIDLKFSDDAHYLRYCGAHHAPVLETIRRMHARGIWVEVTTLVIPGLNDDTAALTDIASSIAAIDTDMPWHVSGFHPMYNMLDVPDTPSSALGRAVAAGKKAGLRYIYEGNIDGESNTACHACAALLIRRHGYTIDENNLRRGRCPACGANIPGVFS